ncbi:MAG TPA: class I poly(R)-hydroxyalkanoic acid synthase [Geminicoccaceae bacterium]|jgi:polyhydroxyalkanoate synthase|nr:class I poly(R)-hydroxyalkanoic acid synthase [Geminicoccaceae bacterium]
MAKQQETLEPESEPLGQVLTEIAGNSQKLMHALAERRCASNGHHGSSDPLNLRPILLELSARLIADPARLVQAQISLWQDYLRLWQTTGRRLLGQPAQPVAEPEQGDRRFRDPAWDDHALFDFIKQAYLVTARWLVNTVNQLDGLDDKSRQKIDFYTRQFVDAMAPSNFVATNPEVLRATVETGGENLLRGLNNLLDDLARGEGKLAIKMTDYDAFAVGRNLALTPGKVVFQTDLMQLIQYAPATEQVHRRPLLIIPPWINKYYILDLQPKNSFIKYAVEQGFTVFVISWVNPGEEHAGKTFEDYMFEGPRAALEAIEKATGETETTVIGYCLGGTLLAAMLAYMAIKRDARVKAATFFASLVDFENPGELGVFIDQEQLDAMDAMMAERGYLEGRQMATTFNMLRANDLIWSFVINNYLLGKEPFPFDLLYWNSDSTRMPYAMHSFYLRKFYQQNQLVVPGGISLGGVPIDLGKIRLPVYLLSTQEDHIAPWLSTYRATQLYRGETTFVLAGSGHIAGVINPPSVQKYGFWTNPELPPDPMDWLAGASHQPGSWWPHWREWNVQHSGELVPARHPGDGKLSVLEDAPGSYVRMRAP